MFRWKGKQKANERFSGLIRCARAIEEFCPPDCSTFIPGNACIY